MSRKRVLLVEDDDEIRSSVADVLDIEGFDVQTAANGLDALRRLENGASPDMILLDMMMPVMDGWQFMEELRKLHKSIQRPVVIFSAYGNPQGMAEELDAAGYLRKPFSVDELVAAIQCSIDQSSPT
jgi:two-component system, chemotaxis family, chemotaxis protein CheY